MGDLRAVLVDEFTTWMGELAARHAGRPRDELHALLLLALEREQLVTVAYRSEIIAERLDAMDVDASTRRAITDAIRWTWRDEQMHARWTRGALLRHADLPERARVLLTGLGGHVAGWASARQHHHRWSDAPVSRAVAELLELAGVAAGRIPAAAREHLHYNTFRDFCAFNAAAEHTAALGWERMAELAPGAGMDEDRAAFTTMAADERRHAALFGALAEAFDASDRLVTPGSELADGFARLGQRFLSTPSAGAPAWQNPLGKGASVAVRQGDDLEATLGEVLAASGLDALVRTRRPERVAIKATFMLAADRLDPSPHVSVELVVALARRLAAGGADVAVIDGRNVYDRFHAHRDVAAVAAYLGLTDPSLRVVDAQLDQSPQAFVRGLGQDSVCRTWRDADLRLIVGKVRSNPLSGAMLALDAAEGLGSRHDTFVFEERGADRGTATMMLLDAHPPHGALLDAWDHVPHGVLGMMACPDPVHPRRLYASRDAVALDCVVARHLGVAPEAWPQSMLLGAFDWFGDPRGDLEVDGPDSPIPGWRSPDATQWGALLSRLAEPVYVHASGRGAAFLPPMDTAAFPPLELPSPALRLARAVVRSLVTLEGPPDGLASRHVLVSGRRVRIADTGGDGVPVVLLHGYPENLHLWARVVRRLGSRRCIALDWPGLGDSEALPDGADDPEGLARQLGRILDTLAVDDVHLVGADMGAQPALCFAALHPERTRTVAVLNHLAFGDADTSVEIALMRRAGLGTAALRAAPWIVWRQCMRTFLPGSGLPDGLGDDLWACFRRAEVRRHLAALCRGYERALPTLPDLYGTIRPPALVLWGVRDPHFPEAQARRLADALPRAELELFADAGHWLHWTHAEAVATRLETHLQENECTS